MACPIFRLGLALSPRASDSLPWFAKIGPHPRESVFASRKKKAGFKPALRGKQGGGKEGRGWFSCFQGEAREPSPRFTLFRIRLVYSSPSDDVLYVGHKVLMEVFTTKRIFNGGLNEAEFVADIIATAFKIIGHNFLQFAEFA